MSAQTPVQMQSQQITQPALTNQTIPPIAPIDPTPLVTHGESPTAIILALAILIVLSLGSLTQLLRVIVVAMRRPVK
jgi:hypothetical protein